MTALRRLFFSMFLCIIAVAVAADATVPVQGHTSFAPIIKKVAQAVVHIQVTHESNFSSPFAGDPFFQSFFGENFGMKNKVKEKAAGSGNIVSADGLVMTCAHVVKGGSDISVKLVNGREYPAKVLTIDEKNDLALLKIVTKEKVDFTYLPVGNSDDSEVGDFVIAIGYPFGIRQSVTSGIISSVDQPFHDKTVLQTDAAVNPGNSGGALINLKGELIGVPNAILSRSGGFHGIGFAIPSLTFKKLIASGGDAASYKSGWHGISVKVVQAKLKDADEEVEEGPVTVVRLHEKSPAKEAGLQVSDIIESVQGKDIRSVHDFNTRLGALNASDSVTFTLKRGDEKKDISFKLIEAPKEQGAYKIEKGPLAGVVFQNLKDVIANDNDERDGGEGVVITEMPRNMAGNPFLPGDVVLSINGKDIKSVDDIKDAIDNRGVSAFTIQRGNMLIQSSSSGGGSPFRGGGL